MNLYIPRHPSKIKLKQFVAFHAAKSDAEKVRVITGISEKQVRGLKIETVDLIITTFEQAALQASDHQPMVRVDRGLHSKRLGFIPDLSSMSLAEYVDIDDYRNAIWPKSGKQFYKHLPLLMAVLYRPIKTRWPIGSKFYRIAPYDVDQTRFYIDYINDMPMSVVNGALLFFSTLQNRLRESFPDYSATQVRKVVENLQAL